MVRVLLIRHGEPTDPWHVADDPGLSAKGVAQAETAAAALELRGRFDVVSSPLRRCQETSIPMVRRGFGPALIEQRVTEVPSPALADRQAWLRATFPGAIEGGEKAGWDRGGAAIEAWRDGVVAALRGFERDTAVFTHFVAINAAVSAALERDEAIVCRPAHASITELVCENGVLRLVAHGAQVDGRALA